MLTLDPRSHSHRSGVLFRWPSKQSCLGSAWKALRGELLFVWKWPLGAVALGLQTRLVYRERGSTRFCVHRQTYFTA